MATTFRATTLPTQVGATSRTDTKPAGVVDGDMMLYYVGVNSSVTTVTMPAGWTLLETIQLSGTNHVLRIYSKIAASEPADYTVNFSTTPQSSGGIIAWYSDIGRPLFVDVHNQQNNASGNRLWASLTTTVANDALNWFAIQNANVTSTPPGGSTERWDVGGSVVKAYLMTEIVAAVGATGTRTATGTAVISATVGVAIAETPTPADPTGLTATAISTTEIDLAWTDNATNETAYSIERSPNGSTGWVEIATHGANATAFSDTGLTPATEYFYRVRANNAGIYSGYSNTDSATTDSLAPTSAPDNLTATPITASRVDLAWEHDGVNTVGYSIEQSPNGTTGWAEIATTPDKHYSVTGLAENTTFYWRVRAYNL